MSTIDTYLERNARYAESTAEPALPVPPSKKLTIVTCMDARMDICALLGLEPGDAHILRNAGGVVTDDMIRSLMLSQRLLGTREIMLIHHTECGALMFTDDELKAEVERETGVRPPFALESFADLDDDVRQSIARIQTSPFVPHKDSVRGFVYDVQTRLLREVDRARP